MDARAQGEATPSLRSIRFGFAVLAAINLFNYLDRYVLPAVLAQVEAALHLTDTQGGQLGVAFLVVYFIVAPVFGRLGDTRGRRAAIAVGVAIWSLATVGSGLAWSFAVLLAARALVGVGEAAYGSISPSLLSDYYPPAQRNRVLTWFNVAVPVGSAVGFALGGYIDKHFGWRWAFGVAGLPGLVLAGLVLTIPDPQRGRYDDPAMAAREVRSLRAALAELLPNREYVWTVLGYAAYTFVIGGIAYWLPTFLARARGMPLDRASEILGGIAVVTGIGGTLTGGWLADRLRGVVRNPYLTLSGCSLLAAFPFTVTALRATRPGLIWTMVFFGELLLFLSTGPVNAVIVNCVAPGVRAMAMAVCIFVIHLLGDALAIYLIGRLSDRLHSLARAVLVVPGVLVLGGVIWIVTARLVPEGQPADPARENRPSTGVG